MRICGEKQAGLGLRGLEPLDRKLGQQRGKSRSRFSTRVGPLQILSNLSQSIKPFLFSSGRRAVSGGKLERAGGQAQAGLACLSGQSNVFFGFLGSQIPVSLHKGPAHPSPPSREVEVVRPMSMSLRMRRFGM